MRKKRNSYYKIRIIVSFSLCLISLTVVRIDAEILFRNTFEEYEGNFQQQGWVINTLPNGLVIPDGERDDDYQKQAHGAWSMRIYDPENSSLANARHIFPIQMVPDHPEYMTEFYLWIPSEGEALNNFYAYYPTRGVNPADITITLEEYTGPPPDHVFAVYVTDASGTNFVKTLNVDVWHKFQIHKLFNSSTINFYINGDSIDSYTSISGVEHPDSFLFGTELLTQNGEGFYDDVIVTTPPTGEHPRLLFTEDDVEMLRLRAEDTTALPTGRSYKFYADKMKGYASDYADWDTIIKITGQFGEDYELIHPYRYPAFYFHTDHRDIVAWNRLGGAILTKLEILALSSVLEPGNRVYIETTKEILLSLTQWLQWTNPDATYNGRHHKDNQYCFLGTWKLIQSTSLAYDMIFNCLNSYEKMSIQNAILTLGVGQLYLESLHGNIGSNLGRSGDFKGGKFPNIYAIFNGSLGIGALTVFENESQELDTARLRIDSLFSTSRICDSMGGWIEGFAYSHYALLPITIFSAADSIARGNNTLINDPYLRESCYFHLYSILPGGAGEEINFGDARFYYRSSLYPAILASKYSDEFIQYYLLKTEFVDPILQFLWLDKDVGILNPEDYLSPGRLFPDIGWAIFRTGWDADDYLLAMKSGPGVGHTHQDNNSIVFGTNKKRCLVSASIGQIGENL